MSQNSYETCYNMSQWAMTGDLASRLFHLEIGIVKYYESMNTMRLQNTVNPGIIVGVGVGIWECIWSNRTTGIQVSVVQDFS